jgi:choline-sulfatase
VDSSLRSAHPYDPPEPFRSQFTSRGPAGLYDGEIAFADHQIDRVASWLGSAGVDERTVIVVMSDHGEGLGSHGEGTHGYFLYDYAVHVPVIVSTPFDELRGVRVDAQVSLVDVFPTVLGLAGIDSNARVHGRSLLPLMFGRQAPDTVSAYSESMSPNLHYGWSPLRSLRTPRYKLIQAPRLELFDLQADPGETTNVFAQHRAVAARMNQELERLIGETSRNAPAPEAANLDKETIERLASLTLIGMGLAALAARRWR